MLTPFRVDTNSLLITDRLNAVGYDVRLKAVVADDVGELARVLEGALAWADLIVITGGLGPTEDDITRDAVARVLGIPLDVDEEIVDRIRERFARRGMTMQPKTAGRGWCRAERRCSPTRTARRLACGSSGARRRSCCCQVRRAR